MDFSELSPEQQKKIMEQQRFCMKSPEEINDLCNTGMFNSIIEGYCRIVFEELGLSDKLKGYSFYELFDFVDAATARAKSK